MEVTRSCQPSTAGMALKNRTFLRSDWGKRKSNTRSLEGATYRIHVGKNGGEEQLHNPVLLYTVPLDTLRTLPL
jgi:hypothetical protein